MATEKRQTAASVDELARLLAVSGGQFHPLLRRLERELARQGRQRAPVGFEGPARDEALRLRAATGLAFPAAEVVDLRPTDSASAGGPPYELKVSFMGLTGPSGVLPAHYTNTVGRRSRQRDQALADFLNLFDHRLLGLFHRAWGKYKPTIQLEGRKPRPADIDPYSRAVDALSGQRPRQGNDTRRFYAGHFARRGRSASGLESLLRDYLGQPVEVESLVGQWLSLSRRDRARLGSGRNGANNRLGGGMLTGRRIWNVDSRIAIHIGPVSHLEHRSLIPGASRYSGLQALIDAYVPPNLTVDLHFHLGDHGERPPPLGRSLQLGRSSWLAGRGQPLGHCSIRLQRGPAASGREPA